MIDGEMSERFATDELTVAECWDLMSAAVVGRLAVCIAGRAHIFPINFISARRRMPISGKLKVTRRRSTTTTRYRSTWDGPTAEGQTASRHEADDPLSPAEADQLIEMLEDPQFEVVVEGAGSEDEARQHLVAMLGDRANVAPTGDEPSRSSSTELPRSTAIGLMAAGATVALVYAQLVL